MPEDLLDYDRAAWRIGRNLAILAATGVATLLVTKGWRWGAGVFLGLVISWFNYRGLRRLVESLGEGRKPRARRMRAILRYLLVAAVAYVIVRYTPISALAVLVGVFVLIAAVF